MGHDFVHDVKISIVIAKNVQLPNMVVAFWTSQKFASNYKKQHGC